MQENEFEKQVKQKMGEFRLRPSEPVWLEIRKDLLRKRRRRILLLLPLAALLLAGGYFAVQSVFSDKQLQGTTQDIAVKKEKDNNTTQGSDTNNTTNNSVKKAVPDTRFADPVSNNKDKAAGEKSNEYVNGNKDIAVNKTKNVEKDKLKETKKIEITDVTAFRKKDSHKDHDDLSLHSGKKKSGDGISAAYSGGAENESLRNTDKNRIDRSVLIDNNGNGQALNENGSLETGFVSADRKLMDNTPVSPAATIRLQMSSDSISGNRLQGVQLPVINNNDFRTQKTLKIGLTLAIGASSRANKPLQLLNSSSAEKSLASSFGAVGGINQGSFAGGVLVLPPSDVKPGVAFKAGITVSKSLSKRFNISSGLLYSFSSDHIKVGKSLNYSLSYSSNYNLDVRNQSSYANVQNTDYTNKYHFIELPVSISYNLTRKWRYPLTWNAGVSVSRLVSTNALLYDAAWGGVYYDGKRDINKTQLNLSTGFSLRFDGHNGWQWNIGPQLYISASKLFNSAYDENKHLLYGGLHMQVLLPSRKRSK
jgi:hypothetical protein